MMRACLLLAALLACAEASVPTRVNARLSPRGLGGRVRPGGVHKTNQGEGPAMEDLSWWPKSDAPQAHKRAHVSAKAQPAPQALWETFCKEDEICMTLCFMNCLGRVLNRMTPYAFMLNRIFTCADGRAVRNAAA